MWYWAGFPVPSFAHLQWVKFKIIQAKDFARRTWHTRTNSMEMSCRFIKSKYFFNVEQGGELGRWDGIRTHCAFKQRRDAKLYFSI